MTGWEEPKKKASMQPKADVGSETRTRRPPMRVKRKKGNFLGHYQWEAKDLGGYLKS